MASSPNISSGSSSPNRADALLVSSGAKTYPLFQSSSQTSSIKLDRSNYLVWESVVLPLIEGNRLQRHIDADASTPSFTTVLPGTDTVIPNPEFEDGYSVDRMLMGWLRNTMTQDVATQLLHCQTSLQLWTEPRALTSAVSKSRIMVYRSELHSTRKSGISMTEYLSRMKRTADHLALAGAPISVDELVLYTQNGLDGDFNPIVVKLIDQDNLSWVDAQSALLAFENRLEQLNQLSSLSIQANNLMLILSNMDRVLNFLCPHLAGSVRLSDLASGSFSTVLCYKLSNNTLEEEEDVEDAMYACVEWPRWPRWPGWPHLELIFWVGTILFMGGLIPLIFVLHFRPVGKVRALSSAACVLMMTFFGVFVTLYLAAQRSSRAVEARGQEEGDAANNREEAQARGQQERDAANNREEAQARGQQERDAANIREEAPAAH